MNLRPPAYEAGEMTELLYSATEWPLAGKMNENLLGALAPCTQRLQKKGIKTTSKTMLIDWKSCCQEETPNGQEALPDYVEVKEVC